MIVTQEGRVIVVYDGHGSGQQIRWRDRGRSWQGAEGSYLAGDAPNDRPASLATFSSGGEQHAWLVSSGYAFASDAGEVYTSRIQLWRLSNLDAAGGPSIGNAVTLDPSTANLRVDLAVHGGEGALVWTRRTPAGTYEVVAARLAGTGPTLSNEQVLVSNAHAEATATLVYAAGAMRAVVANAGDLGMWTFNGSSWSGGMTSAAVATTARPSAVEVGSDVLVAAESGSAVRIHNLSGSTGEETFSGYGQPTIASNGSRAWVFMVDSSDDLVSYELAGGAWGTRRTEISNEGRLAWPNALRGVKDGKLRVLLDGADCTERNRNPVLYLERPAAGSSMPPPSGEVRVSVGNVSVTEGNRDSVNARFRLSLSEASSRRVTVSYRTSDGSAVAGNDYTAKSGTATFSAGTTSKTVSVAVLGDRRDEPNEEFFLQLSNPNRAVLGDARGVATIVDNDAPRALATVKVRRLAKRLAVSGTVRPSLAGRHVRTTLFRKRAGRFVQVAVKTPVLRESLSAGTREVSSYKTRLRRPKQGRCKVVTKVARRGQLRGTKAVRYFKC
jgi:hypothetical protein